MKSEVYANAGAVPSPLGGGIYGHLGAIMPAAAYGALPGAIAWVAPAHPGAGPAVVPGMTQFQLIRGYVSC